MEHLTTIYAYGMDIPVPCTIVDGCFEEVTTTRETILTQLESQLKQGNTEVIEAIVQLANDWMSNEDIHEALNG